MQPSLRRTMGNAQARNSAIGKQPQWNYTDNVTGAQTASAYDPNRQPPAGVSPQNPAWLASRREAARMNPRKPTPTELYEADPTQMASASAYDPNRQPPAGLNPFQMQQWDQSRQEAARMNQVQQIAPMSPLMSTQSQQAPYAGGDVAGQAQYYRQTALQGYRPPGNSSQQGMIARSVQDANPNADFRSSQYSALNGYDGFTAAINDPNRLTPDQRFLIAQQSAQGAMNYDPTNQGGNRFAGSASRIMAGQASDQAAIAAGTQAERERMQGIAQNSDARAMDPDSQSRQFAYENPQGQMVATNRLGQLQQLQQQFPDDPQVRIAIAEEKQRQSTLGQEQEDQRERRRAASSDGLTDRERRTLGYRNQVATNAAARGILPSGKPDPDRPGFSMKERIDRNNQLAKDKSNFRASETKLRRSALNAENAKNLQSLYDREAKKDRTPRADGQLNPTIRKAATDTLKNLVDLNYQSSREFRQNQDHIDAYGLKPWSAKDEGWITSGGDSPSDVAKKVTDMGVNNLQQAQSLRKYWNAQKDSDAEWFKKYDGNDPNVKLMEELASVPESDLQKFLDEKHKEGLFRKRWDGYRL